MAKMGKITAEIDLQMNLNFHGKRVIMLDIDTGDWILPVTISGGDGARLAASVLPGWPAELIDKAYSEWMADDPAPFQEMIETESYGTISRTVFSVLAASGVTPAEYQDLRDDFGENWSEMSFAVGQHLDSRGKYCAP